MGGCARRSIANAAWRMAAMSLINQMLNDLEKRGEKGPLTKSPVRAVPVKRNSRSGLYVLVALMLFGVMLVSWWLFHKPTVLSSLSSSVNLAMENNPLFSPMVANLQAVTETPMEVIKQTNSQESVVEVLPSIELAVASSPSRMSSKAVAGLVEAHEDIRLAVNKSDASIEPTGSVSKKFIKISPQQQAENEFRKANLFAQKGLLKDAVTAYTAALHLDPGHGIAREALVAVLLKSKLNAEAEKLLQEGLEQNPKQTHFAMLLARLQVERNALSVALYTLEKFQQYANQKADYQAFMAALLQRQNRHAEAVNYYRAALQLSPNSGAWLMGVGISLQALQRKEEARHAYQRAIEVRNLSSELQVFVVKRLSEIQ